MLYQYVEKVKFWMGENKGDLYIAALIFLVGLCSFGLGRLSVLWPEREPISIEKYELRSADATVTSGDTENLYLDSPSKAPALQDKYVASKNGAAYHFPWCPGALKIKEENKIWFETKEEAERAGYKPAGNCDGL